MREITDFSLDSAAAVRTGSSVLLFRGRRADTVPASVIDAQFAVLGGFLVLVSYNDIFSALETILFLDPAGTVRERLTLGDATAQGLITEIQPEGENTLTFAFPGNERRRLQVGLERRFLGLRQSWLRLV